MKDHQENAIFENNFLTLVVTLLLSMSSDDNEISELSDKFDCVWVGRW